MEKDSQLCIPNLRSPKPTLHAPGGSIPWVEATRTWASMSDTSIAKCQKFLIPKGSKCTNRWLLGYIYLRMYEITSVYTYMPQHSGLVTLSTKSSEAIDYTCSPEVWPRISWLWRSVNNATLQVLYTAGQKTLSSSKEPCIIQAATLYPIGSIVVPFCGL